MSEPSQQIADVLEALDGLDYEKVARGALDALKADRWAVVKLPESSSPPDKPNNDGYMRCLGTWPCGDSAVALWDDDGGITIPDGQELSAADARELAAALLAAADAAETRIVK